MSVECDFCSRRFLRHFFLLRVGMHTELAQRAQFEQRGLLQRRTRVQADKDVPGTVPHQKLGMSSWGRSYPVPGWGSYYQRVIIIQYSLHVAPTVRVPITAVGAHTSGFHV